MSAMKYRGVNKMNPRSNPLNIVVLLTLFLSMVTAPSLALELPGRQMISTVAVAPATAWAALEGSSLPTITDPSLPVSPEITALVRALRNDPDLIFSFVHDTIEYELGYGVRKGALGTLLDGRGNAYDQAVLLVTLLRQAGFTASYVHGTITLTSAELENWLGLEAPTADMIRRVLGSAGLPVTTTPATGPTLTSAVMDHVWVEVEIDSTTYVFDPSLKTHTYSTPLISSRPALGSALGGYTAAGLVNDAGGTVAQNQVENLNRTNIRQDLATYANDLTAYIKTQQPDGDFRSIFGGRTIDPSPVQVRETSLSYAIEDEVWTGEVPDCYHTLLTLRYGGAELTLRSADIYGRRLTVWPTSDTGVEIRLDGQVLAEGAIGSILYVFINHPYVISGTVTTYGDQEGVIARLDNTVFHIYASFGESGPGLVESHRRILQDLINSGATADSEAVLGETLALIGFNHAAQLSMSNQLLDQITKHLIVNHHTVGVVGQTTEGENQRVVMDLAFGRSSHLTPTTGHQQFVFLHGPGRPGQYVRGRGH